MDLLAFDAKKGVRRGNRVAVVLSRTEIVAMLGERKIEAVLSGGLVQIFDEQVCEILNEMAGIGQWLEDGRETDPKEWSALTPNVNILTLSAEETVFLACDWQILTLKTSQNDYIDPREIWTKMVDMSGRAEQFGTLFAVYRFLRQNGWIVRSGLTFGCDYLIYCLGAQYFHSSAGVLVADDIDCVHLLTLTRILAHNKKALMMASATCSRPIGSFEDVPSTSVRLVTMKTYFLERDSAALSSRANQIYNNVVD